jgi:hypothetical protein
MEKPDFDDFIKQIDDIVFNYDIRKEIKEGRIWYYYNNAEGIADIMKGLFLIVRNNTHDMVWTQMGIYNIDFKNRIPKRLKWNKNDIDELNLWDKKEVQKYFNKIEHETKVTTDMIKRIKFNNKIQEIEKL